LLRLAFTPKMLVGASRMIFRGRTSPPNVVASSLPPRRGTILRALCPCRAGLSRLLRPAYPGGKPGIFLAFGPVRTAFSGRTGSQTPRVVDSDLERSPCPLRHRQSRKGRSPRNPLALRPPRNSQKPRSEEHTSELQSRFDLVCR